MTEKEFEVAERELRASLQKFVGQRMNRFWRWRIRKAMNKWWKKYGETRNARISLGSNNEDKRIVILDFTTTEENNE